MLRVLVGTGVPSGLGSRGMLKSIIISDICDEFVRYKMSRIFHEN